MKQNGFTRTVKVGGRAKNADGLKVRLVRVHNDSNGVPTATLLFTPRDLDASGETSDTTSGENTGSRLN